MLAHLRIQDFALIEELELDLEPGLNVLTGETGAGKSLLVDAVSLLRGGKADPALVRTGREQARVEAVFQLDAELASELGPVVEEIGGQLEDALVGEDAKELVITRVISKGGKSRVYVGGALVTVAALARLGPALIDLAGQHEHQGLIDPASHLAILDAFAIRAGLLSEELLGQMAEAHAARESAARALAEASLDERTRAHQEDLLAFQLREIDALELSPGEDAELVRERERLRHAEKLQGAASRGAEELYGMQGAVSERLARICKELGSLGGIEPRFGVLSQDLEQARTQVEEAARELSRFAAWLEADPERLSEVEERTHTLARLARKHAPAAPPGEQADAVLAQRQLIADQLAALSSHEERRAAAARALEAAELRGRKLGLELRQHRQGAAHELAGRVGTELADLGMTGALLAVHFEPLAAVDGSGAALTSRGLDRLEFLLGANVGEEPRPLARVASGGELSRVMLALKRILASADPVSTYVFDEVDAGIGGATGEIVGRKIREVASSHQVVCVTHLAQIACFAEAHFEVSKETGDDSRTRTRIRRLSSAERTDEVARMLGGAKSSTKARAHAQEMLKMARREA